MSDVNVSVARDAVSEKDVSITVKLPDGWQMTFACGPKVMKDRDPREFFRGFLIWETALTDSIEHYLGLPSEQKAHWLKMQARDRAMENENV